MASSRSVSRKKDIGVSLVALLLLAFTLSVCATVASQRAYAQGIASTDDIAKSSVEVTGLSAQFLAVTTNSNGDASLELSRVVPMALSSTCSPESIQTGISCGMADMCGLDPCLCGAADEWGCCACSGTETTFPAVAYKSSDESVVRVAEVFGRQWLIPVGAGTATITCEATLIHHETVPATFEVHVAGPTAADALAAVLVVAAIAIIVGIIACIIRFVRRAKEGSNRA